MIYWLLFWLFVFFTVSMNPLVMMGCFVIVLILFVLSLVFILTNYLFSYLMFMLFMTGLVIILMYFCSVIFSEKVNIFLDFIFYVVVGLTFYFLLNEFFFFDFNFIQFKNYYFEFFNFIKYLAYSYSVYSVFFIVYLFFCLIAVYEILKKCSGPLRIKS